MNEQETAFDKWYDGPEAYRERAEAAWDAGIDEAVNRTAKYLATYPDTDLSCGHCQGSLLLAARGGGG